MRVWQGSLQDHPGTDGIVVALIDDDEGPGAAVFQVGVDEQRLGELDRKSVV